MVPTGLKKGGCIKDNKTKVIVFKENKGKKKYTVDFGSGEAAVAA